MRALFIWMLEALIGLIPFAANVASAALSSVPAAHARDNDLPELCVLGVVASALALLSLLRDWFKLEARDANALTVVLAVANIMACLAGAFLYPFADHDMLTAGFQNLPGLTLAAALTASFFLAGERGFNSGR